MKEHICTQCGGIYKLIHVNIYMYIDMLIYVHIYLYFYTNTYIRHARIGGHSDAARRHDVACCCCSAWMGQDMRGWVYGNAGMDIHTCDMTHAYV